MPVKNLWKTVIAIPAVQFNTSAPGQKNLRSKITRNRLLMLRNLEE